MTVSLPWGAWYLNTRCELALPDSWAVDEYKGPEGMADLRGHARQACQKPLSSPRLRDLAANRNKVMIAIDDTTRPTPTGPILSEVLDELALAGVDDTQVTVIVASGGHRPPTRRDMVLKLGEALLQRIRLIYHHAHEGLVYLGKTSYGTPVHTNRLFQQADLKIGIGSITPHDFAGFGGGGKIVAIGLAGIETLHHDHMLQAEHFRRSVANIEQNDCQADIRQIANMVGLDFLVNAVPSQDLQPLQIVGGAYTAVHAHCAELMRSAWEVTLRQPTYDVAFLNAYPKDNDLIQSYMALNVCLFPCVEMLKESGIAVLTTPAPDGAATHSLGGFGCRGYEIPAAAILKGRRLAVFSPCLNPYDTDGYFPAGTISFHSREQMLSFLIEELPGQRQAAVFHNASLQWLAE